MRGRQKISEQADQALTQAKSMQQELGWLRKQLQRQRTILQALVKLTSAKLGLTEDALLAEVERMEVEEKNRPRVADLCPQCGRSLQENHTICIYCGSDVKRRELF